MPTSISATPAPGHFASAHSDRSGRVDAELRAFTRSGGSPRATFPLVLLSVAVAAVAMDVDAVTNYSRDAFLDGLALTALLALAIGELVHRLPTGRLRTMASLFLPAIFGAGIGVVVQEVVLQNVGHSWYDGIKDLGGLVDTRDPASWIAAGVVLGGAPALLVSVFLLIASRAIRRLTGHDASESFGVGFTGAAGLFASAGLFVVGDLAKAPLLLVAIASAVTLIVTLLIDSARLRFLRKVYAGSDGAFEIAPAEAFAHDPSIAPLVGAAEVGAVLVRVDQQLGSYRAAAAQPIALLANTEEETVRPLRRRCLAATLLFASVLALSLVAGLARLS